MSTLLIIDTSSSTCSVVIAKEGQFQEVNSTLPKTHAKLLLSMIDGLLTQTETTLGDLDALGVVSGPGSFTGLRIGIGVIQGLAFSLSKPVILLSSLELLSIEAALKLSSEGILATLKSKPGEIYFACYRRRENGGVDLIGREQVVAPDEVEIPYSCIDINEWYGVGDGWQYLKKFRDRIGVNTIKIDESLQSSACVLSKLALSKFEDQQVVEAENALPTYLKEQLDYQTSK